MLKVCEALRVDVTRADAGLSMSPVPRAGPECAHLPNALLAVCSRQVKLGLWDSAALI